VVLRAIACFDYQSCEHEEWPDSKAHDLMDALHAAILQRHPDLGELVPGRSGKTYRYTTLPAYGDAPWVIKVLEDVIPVHA
jgi:hypothetical protein